MIGDLTGTYIQLYIIPKELDKTLSDTDFIPYNYTGYVAAIKAEGAINKLTSFDATLVNITSIRDKAIVTVGSIAYLFAGTKLVGKFVLNKPIYGSDYMCRITGFTSTGTEIINRKLLNENMGKVQFKNSQTCDILKEACYPQGILMDSTCAPILALDPTNYGGIDRHDISFDYHNRVEALNKLAATVGQEWWVDHGSNGDNPYSAGDILNIAMQKGSIVSTYTFWVGGADQNCNISTGGEDTQTNANHIILQGQDQKNTQIQAETYDATGAYTCITKSLDGWLNADISDGSSDPGQTYIPLTPDSMCSLRAVGLTPNVALFKIGSEGIEATNITGSPPCLTGVTRGVSGYNITGAKLYNLNAVAPHKKGDDVIYYQRMCQINPSTWGCIPLRLCVADSSVFCSTATQYTPGCTDGEFHFIQIGSETMSINKAPSVSNYIDICRGFWNPPGEAYAHGDRVLVREAGRPFGSDPNYPASWIPAHPHNLLNFGGHITTYSSIVCGLLSGSCAEVTSSCYDVRYGSCLIVKNITGNFDLNESVATINGSTMNTCMGYNTNSIQQCGLYSKTIADNTAANRHMLDLQAQRILLTKRLPTKRITINPINPIAAWNQIDMGDIVTLGNGSQMGFEDNESVRVTGFNLQFDEGAISISFYANDPETRLYATTDMTYTDEKRSTETPQQQLPLRDFNKYTTDASSNLASDCWSAGIKQYKDVMNPTDDYDAVNLRTLSACVCCGVGVNYWCCFGTGPNFCLKPCHICCQGNILPWKNAADSGNSLGQSNCRWFEVRSTNLFADYAEITTPGGDGWLTANYLEGNGANIWGIPALVKDQVGTFITPSDLSGCGCANTIKIIGCCGISALASGAGCIIICGTSTTNYWASGGTNIHPCVDCNVAPNTNGCCTLGTSSCYWCGAYFKCQICFCNSTTCASISMETPCSLAFYVKGTGMMCLQYDPSNSCLALLSGTLLKSDHILPGANASKNIGGAACYYNAVHACYFCGGNKSSGCVCCACLADFATLAGNGPVCKYCYSYQCIPATTRSGIIASVAVASGCVISFTAQAVDAINGAWYGVPLSIWRYNASCILLAVWNCDTVAHCYAYHVMVH